MRRGVRRVADLRAWRACQAYQVAVYRVCAEGPLAGDWQWRRRIEEAAAAPPAQLADGFGRFNVADFAGFAAVAHASLIESRGHLREAVDKAFIDETVRLRLEALADAAIRDVMALMEYLQTAEAIRRARLARDRTASHQ